MKKVAVILCNDMHMDIANANNLLNCVEQNGNYEIVCDYTIADIVIIITCAFGPKKMYSVRVIADVRINSKTDAEVIVTGCLLKLNLDELKAIPDIRVESFEELLLSFGLPTEKSRAIIPQNKVIISKGCNHKCSYCVYPLIVGRYKSESIETILKEVEALYETESTIYITGALETSDYGFDLYGERKFAYLLESIVTKFPNSNYVIGWVNPAGLTDEVISVISRYSNIVEIMLHIQHSDDEILTSMNRPTFEDTDKKIRRLKESRPDLIISTEVIVGFPGETEEKFQDLVEYLNRGYFEDIGVASYEAVLGTEAAILPNQVSKEQKAQRMNYIKDNFLATCYPSDESSSQSVIEEYIKAYNVLTRLPKSILKDTQQYNCIAGVDTISKLEKLEEHVGEVFGLIENSRTEFDIQKNHKYIDDTYTPEAKKLFFDIFNKCNSKSALIQRAQTLLLKDYTL